MCIHVAISSHFLINISECVVYIVQTLKIHAILLYAVYYTSRYEINQ